MKYDFKKLRAARERKFMSLTDVALLADLSVTTVREVEQGRAPWKKAIRKIAAALDVDVADLQRPRRSA